MPTPPLARALTIIARSLYDSNEIGGRGLSVLNPYGTDINMENRNVHAGGIEWTIKDGIPYHGPTLMAEVKAMVAAACATLAPQTSASRP